MTIVTRRCTRLVAATLLAMTLIMDGCGGEDSAGEDRAGEDSAGDGTTIDESQSGTTTGADAPTTVDGAGAEEPVPAFPVTVEADNGPVIIAEQPTAIVSLSPSITEMLYAVGAGDQVAAVDTSSNYPPEAPVTDLSGFRPNVEAIGALAPDLVFVARDSDDVVATLEEVGLTVVHLGSAATLDDVYSQIETVGAATGHGEQGAEVAAEVRSEVESLLAEVPDRDEPVTYFYELSSEYSTVTSDTFVGDLLASAGLTNIADGVDDEAGQYPQLSAEFVLSSDPDVLLLAHSDGSVPGDDELAARPGWGDLTAIGQGRVVALDPDVASRWGPRVVELLRAVIDATAGLG